MSDTLSFDEAVTFLPESERIHTFISGGMLIGADWPRADILDAMRATPEIRIAGDTAQSMHHGLAIEHPRTGGTLFVETSRRTDEVLSDSGSE